MIVRPADGRDAAALAAIYNPYVTGTIVTFEEEPVSASEMAQRIGEVTQRWPWLVAESTSGIEGFAYATAWKSRSAYRFSVETTVYVANGCQRQGVGTALYSALLPQLRALGLRNAVGGIALPNEASVALHERLGFVNIGRFREIGFKLGRWIDVGYWQKTL